MIKSEHIYKKEGERKMKNKSVAKPIIGVLVILFVIFVIAINFINKGNYNKMTENVCEANCIQKLENSKDVLIYKDPIDTKKEYSIFVKDELVAKVKGKTFKLFGDVYSLYDVEDNPLLIEEGRNSLTGKNGKLKFDRGGVILNGENEEVGYLYEPLSLTKTTFELSELDETLKAKLTGKTRFFKIRSEFVITDEDEKEVYTLKEQWSLSETKYQMSVLDTTKVSVQEAILLAIAADEENDK